VVLPDGQVLADAEPSNITVQHLPQTWTGTAEDPAATAQSMTGGMLTANYPLAIVGRGPARLEMTAVVAQPAGMDSDVQLRVGLIGAASLMALLVVYRRIRARLAGL